MSRRESGSDTWPRSAAFPGDNLDLGNAPEEDDVDHGSESSSWLSGTSAVGTGADPPDADLESEADHDEHPYPADIGTARDATEAPGFSDVPAPDHEDAPFPGHGFSGDPGYSAEPGYDEDAADDQGFEAPADAPGFEAPAASPGFGAAQPTDAFGAPAAAGYGSQPEAGPGFEHQDFHDPGYDNGQRGEHADDYQGEYAAAYQGGGFGAAPPGHSYGGQAYGPAPGTGYPGQENGAPVREQAPPFPGQYQPVEPPRAKVKASFRPFRRGKSSTRNRPGRQAQLTVARVEPWSVMKFSFVISLVAFIVLFVAVACLYGVLSGLGVFSALQRTIASITSSQSSSGFNLTTYLSASRVLGYTGLLGAINVVLITAASTVGSVLYNITADLAGGIEVTLKETD
jgi:hypothetical protein